MISVFLFVYSVYINNINIINTSDKQHYFFLPFPLPPPTGAVIMLLRNPY